MKQLEPLMVVETIGVEPDLAAVVVMTVDLVETDFA